MRDDILLKEIGARIKSKRKAIAMTQETLAEKMDVSIQMISNLEQGKKAIRPENIIKLCNALNVSSDYILRGQISDYELGELEQSFSALSQEDQNLIRALIKKIPKK